MYNFKEMFRIRLLGTFSHILSVTREFSVLCFLLMEGMNVRFLLVGNFRNLFIRYLKIKCGGEGKVV